MVVSIFTLGVIVVGSLVVEYVSSKPTPRCGGNPAPATNNGTNNNPTSCFPAIDFTMPTSTPNSLTDWWCSPDTEYAFVGFSYDVTSCQSLSTLKKEFLNIRKKFNGRYVRMYGACDDKGFYDNIVEAAWDAGIGVHALIWFGFDGGDEWKKRRDVVFKTLHSNPKAKFVTRVVQFGSEPLFDDVLPPSVLAQQVRAAKTNLTSLRIPVTVSDLAYSWQERKGSIPDLMDAIDSINAHMLPFFATKATTGNKAWPLVTSDINWFLKNGQRKKIYLSENGWPSVTSSSVQPNSKAAVPSVKSEEGYFNLLDEQCLYFKKSSGGGIAWFAHIYSDSQDAGYGIHNSKGVLKFNFAPRTSC